MVNAKKKYSERNDVIAFSGQLLVDVKGSTLYRT